MITYLYLSLLPESLIASMLPPEEFGNYYAVGTKKRTRGQAMFIEVDPNFKTGYFPLRDVEQRCVPHPDGEPKRSVYLSIYQVLEHVPLEALLDLHLVTDDGRVLAIEKADYTPDTEKQLHLYQEFIPVTPRIASNLNPKDFCMYVTDQSHPISVPKLAFADLELNELAIDPIFGVANNLPYPNIDHLRDCLVGLQQHPENPTKTVMRSMTRDIMYRTIKNGFFVGDQETLLYYPFPSKDELQSVHYAWWKSALTHGF